MASRGNDVWVAPSAGLVSRLDPETARVTQRIDPNAGPAAIAVGADATWVTDSDANTVVRIDPTGVLTPIGVGNRPSALAVGAGAVWVANTLAGTRHADRSHHPGRHDDDPGRPGAERNRRRRGGGLGREQRRRHGHPHRSRRRHDPDDRRRRQPEAASSSRRTASGSRSTSGSIGTPASGGTARLSSQNGVDFVDPALAFYPQSWQLLYATCAKLVNYPDKPAPAGSQLTAEVAEALPERSADGKTYTFTIRKGFRFSPPSNQPVTAETFRYTIERTLDPRMKSPAGAYIARRRRRKRLHGRQGAPHQRHHREREQAVDPAGLARSRHRRPAGPAVLLRRADRHPDRPEGPAHDPLGRPLRQSQSYVPGQGVVLVREPQLPREPPSPARSNRPRRSAWRRRRPTSRSRPARRTYAFDGVPAADQPRARRALRAGERCCEERQAAVLRRTRSLGTDFLTLNTHRPLFRDARLRRAVSYAIDRTHAGPARKRPIPYRGRPSDQYLPPGMPGFKDVRIYPFTPDVARPPGGSQATSPGRRSSMPATGLPATSRRRL